MAMDLRIRPTCLLKYLRKHILDLLPARDCESSNLYHLHMLETLLK